MEWVFQGHGNHAAVIGGGPTKCGVRGVRGRGVVRFCARGLAHVASGPTDWRSRGSLTHVAGSACNPPSWGTVAMRMRENQSVESSVGGCGRVFRQKGERGTYFSAIAYTR